jgi:hypothetical protein
LVLAGSMDITGAPTGNTLRWYSALCSSNSSMHGMDTTRTHTLC